MHFGWRVAFSAAGVGLILAVLTLLSFSRRYKQQMQQGATAAAEVEHATSVQSRVGALFLISACALPFWTAIMQSGTSLALWARDNTDRTLSLFGRPTEFAPSSFRAWEAGSFCF